jgi:hypothetical protein
MVWVASNIYLLYYPALASHTVRVSVLKYSPHMDTVVDGFTTISLTQPSGSLHNKTTSSNIISRFILILI